MKNYITKFFKDSKTVDVLIENASLFMIPPYVIPTPHDSNTINDQLEKIKQEGKKCNNERQFDISETMSAKCNFLLQLHVHGLQLER